MRGVKLEDGIMKSLSKTLATILAISAVLVLTGCDVYAVRALEADAAAAERHSDGGEGGGGGGGHHH